MKAKGVFFEEHGYLGRFLVWGCVLGMIEKLHVVYVSGK